MYRKIIWPNNKKFAFTIFDDTDRSNLEDSRLIYNCLDDLGFKTTRSVWINKSNYKNDTEGVTCDNKYYLEWLLKIKEKGLDRIVVSEEELIGKYTNEDLIDTDNSLILKSGFNITSTSVGLYILFGNVPVESSYA